MFATIFLTVLATCAADLLGISVHRPLMRSEAASSLMGDDASPVTSLDKARKNMKESDHGMTTKQTPASKKTSLPQSTGQDAKHVTGSAPKSGKALAAGKSIGKSGGDIKKSEPARTDSSPKASASAKALKAEKPQPKIERDADGNVLTDDNLANRLFKTGSKTAMPQKVSLLREDGITMKKDAKIQKPTSPSSKLRPGQSGSKDAKQALEPTKKPGQAPAARKAVGKSSDDSKKSEQTAAASSSKASAKALKSEKPQPKIERDADGNVLTDDNLANRLFKTSSKTVMPQKMDLLKEDGSTVKKDVKPNKKATSNSKNTPAARGSKDTKHKAESTKKSGQSPKTGKVAGKVGGNAKKSEHASASGSASKKR